MNDSRPRSVVGGFAFPRPGRVLEGGYFQWPLAKLVVSDELLVIGPRGALGKLKKPLRLHFSEIQRIETRSLPRRPLVILISMRLRLADPAFDRTKFWSWGRRMTPVLESLKAGGIAIEPARGPNRR